MRTVSTFLFILLSITSSFSQKKIANKNVEARNYFPSVQIWEHKSPLASGFDSIKLNEAIKFAKENENKNPRNMELSQVMNFGKEPFSEGIGPFADRGDPTGIIIHNGYIICEWGEPSRVDMTHSVTKSFLSTIVGLAIE
ncbi:MAG: serine hydrolase, partial [Bacteroidota bacterium]|nr:serine hydrolase [Bacteroidota bacterium]